MAGRPSFQPTDDHRKRVKAYVAYGIPEDNIAKLIGISPKTLRKHFKTEIESGADEANAQVAQSLFKKALGDGMGSVTAAIFWLKTRARWKETSHLEVTGEDGGPLELSDAKSMLLRGVVPPTSES